MFYHVKIACYQQTSVTKKREARRRDGRNFLPSARARESGRERDISSLSLPADVAATRIRQIPAADVDTKWAPTGLNSHPCQQLG